MKPVNSPFFSRLSSLAILIVLLMIVSCKQDSNPASTGTAPTIKSFTAMPSTITVGDSATLAWTVDNSPTALSIDNGVGDVKSRSSIVVKPSATTTYTLTAANATGSVTSAATVTVSNPGDPGAPLPPANLTAAGAGGGAIKLTWSASVGASIYWIERSVAGSFTQIATSAFTTYTDIGLLPGVTYSFRVRAVNSTGARSGYTNIATLAAPGVISKIELTPTTPATLKPGDTLRLSATVYDASNNDLHIQQKLLTWSSSNMTAATVSNEGLVTALSTLGSTNITASAGSITSNVVTVSVALQKNKILVIYRPKQFSDAGWADYPTALSGFGVDYLTDNLHPQITKVTLDQIKDYERVFYISHEDHPLNSSITSLLLSYSMLENKRLIIMGPSDQLSSDAAFMSYLGVQKDEWVRTQNTALTYTGGAGTAMEGFSMVRINNYLYVSSVTLKSPSSAKAAITTTDISQTDKVITAGFQTNVSETSKVFFCGFVLENVEVAKRPNFMARLINQF